VIDATGKVYLDLAGMEARYPWTRRTIWNYARLPQDPLRGYLIGGKLWFKAEEVEAWIQRRAIKQTDIRQTANEILASLSMNRRKC
jgi:hypothetical protein